jgi:filamentous hemagglutinin family protein
LKQRVLTLSAWAVCALAHAADLPVGGQVTSGAGVIRTDGTSSLVIDQSSARLSIDWSSFSIGAGRSVHFNQPGASSVALNRVTGVDPSLVQGSLTANGQVFLVNPNGVIFGRDARVDVGGLIATTLNITQDDFVNGRYRFSASAAGSNTAVINQGRIHTAPGGTVGLIAARVINDGAIHTPSGQTHLVAADEVLVDFGGPVKVQLLRGTLDALVENGGAITAPGGLVYMRADSANALSRSVINHTGIVEAQTLQTGEAGQIVLLASGPNSSLKATGTLDASAPNGGDGGFIETSAGKLDLGASLRVTTQAASGRTGDWLIDPTNITIISGTDGTIATDASSDTTIGVTTIQSHLATNNLTIQTSSTANGTDLGDITVSAPISWSTNKLTLKAHNDIIVNANLNATGTASLAFEFGTGRNFSFGQGVSAWVPSASSFTWKEGTGAANPLFFNSGALRFGYSGGTNYAAINSGGNLLQPFYNSGGTWYKLTYSTYPLNLAIGINGTATTDPWNLNGTIADITSSTSQRINIAGYRVGNAGTVNAGRAWGELVSETQISVGGSPVSISNTYTLDNSSKYMRAVTALGNPSTSTTDLTNVRLWIGTQDDWVGGTDSPTKTKGNFEEVTGSSPASYSFNQISTASTQAKALKVSSGSETVFFYSTSSGANASINWCCSFSNAYRQNPTTSEITATGDGSYAMFSKFQNLTPGSSNSITWFYAAGAVSDLTSVINAVAGAAQQAEVQQAAASNVATALSLSNRALSAVYGQAPTPPTVTSNNSGGAITYSSSNSSVVQVNATTGAVTLVGPGTATITVSQAAATGFEAGSNTYTLTVQAATPTLAGLPATSPRILFNGSYTSPTVSSASTGAIRYSSSNPSVARVDPVTGVVTPVGMGRVTITVAQDASGGYAASSSSYALDIEAPSLPSVMQVAQSMPLSSNPAAAVNSTSTSNSLISNNLQATAAAIRSAARVIPPAPANVPIRVMPSTAEQVTSQLPATSGGLALMRVASAETIQAAGPATGATGVASDASGAAGTQSAGGESGAGGGDSRAAATTANTASANTGGGDALGFMRVFVVGGGIQMPASTR